MSKTVMGSERKEGDRPNPKVFLTCGVYLVLPGLIGLYRDLRLCLGLYRVFVQGTE